MKVRNRGCKIHLRRHNIHAAWHCAHKKGPGDCRRGEQCPLGPPPPKSGVVTKSKA